MMVPTEAHRIEDQHHQDEPGVNRQEERKKKEMLTMNNTNTVVVMLGLFVLAALTSLLLLAPLMDAGEAVADVTNRVDGSVGSQVEEVVGNHARVQEGLAIRAHADKHNGEAQRIYQQLLEGKCATSMTWCGGSNIEKMHICVDPVTGAVGAVLQFGDEITTGFYEGYEGYWTWRVERENWEVCQ